MFFRLLLESFLRQRRRKALAGIAILLGTTAVTAMLALATTIGDRIHKELAVYGANIVVTPAADQLAVKIGGVTLKPATGNAYLKESDLAKLKTIFWANNITGISPELRVSTDPRAYIRGREPVVVSVTGTWFDHEFGNLKTGAPKLHPWWKLTGQWPRDDDGIDVIPAVVGSRIAQNLDLKIGDRFDVAQRGSASPETLPSPTWYVSGIVSSGDETENQILIPLRNAQILNGNGGSGFVSRVEIAARTKPEDAFARKDPDTLSPKLREVWYCRPYANSIAYQIREAIPGSRAEQVRQVEQTGGTLLARISGLMWLISAAALLAAGFAVSAAMATAVLERRAEIGLMRSLGAGKATVAALFFAETALLALAAGSIGYLAGSALAAWLGARIFSSEAHTTIFNPVLLPVVVALALLVALAGSTPSIRSALSLNPSTILREDG